MSKPHLHLGKSNLKYCLIFAEPKNIIHRYMRGAAKRLGLQESTGVCKQYVNMHNGPGTWRVSYMPT